MPIIIPLAKIVGSIAAQILVQFAVIAAIAVISHKLTEEESKEETK